MNQAEGQLSQTFPDYQFKTFSNGWLLQGVLTKPALIKLQNTAIEQFWTFLQTFLKSSSAFKDYLAESSGDFHHIRRSQDGNAFFEVCSAAEYTFLTFAHNINGRRIYAEGTLDAIQFLQKKIKAGEKGKAYSMIDVLAET